MPEPMAEGAQSGSVELAGLVDLPALERFVAERLPSAETRVTIEGRALSGSSNVTLFLSRGEDRWVLRRPPRGPLLPTSHDMLREFKFISALHGTDVPVPLPVLACDDPTVIGAPFYLMQRVDGCVFQQHIPAEFETPAERRRIGEQAITVLAAIHAAEWREKGLPGRPDGYLDRQIRRWTGQAELTHTAGRLRGLPAITAWVQAHRPASGPATIVHGDYGLHNMIWSSHAPASIMAVLDWEMATIGDPLADVVWFVRDWGKSPTRNPANPITSRPGSPTSEEMFALYEEKSGRKLENVEFYQVFNMWKGAIILEGLYAGYVDGNAANPDVARFEYEVPTLVDNITETIKNL